MARTHKVGIDYFSHDVDMCQDNKIRLLIAKYDLDGYGVYNRLLEEIYRDKGYYIKLTEDFNILFANDNNLEIDVYINILNDCINRELFDKDLYKKYNILTSKRIQNNYIDATIRRKSVDFIDEFLLINIEDIKDRYSKYTETDVNINSINVNINGENDNINSQRKGKERREEKKEKEKENKNKEKEKFDPRKSDYTDEYKELYDMYPRVGSKRRGMVNYYKRKKDHSKEELFKCVKAYIQEVKKNKTEKKYITKIGNFFGKKMQFEDYLESELEERSEDNGRNQQNLKYDYDSKEERAKALGITIEELKKWEEEEVEI